MDVSMGLLGVLFGNGECFPLILAHCKGSQQHLPLIFKEHLPYLQLSITNI
jgi:hypothetical protein